MRAQRQVAELNPNVGKKPQMRPGQKTLIGRMGIGKPLRPGAPRAGGQEGKKRKEEIERRLKGQDIKMMSDPARPNNCSKEFARPCALRACGVVGWKEKDMKLGKIRKAMNRKERKEGKRMKGKSIKMMSDPARPKHP